MNNPINYFDPSGHKRCDGLNSGDRTCDQITKNDISELIRLSYGWTIDESLSGREIEMIFSAGETIANYISSATGKWGQGWVRSNLGNAKFNQNAITNVSAGIFRAGAFVFPSSDVNLNKGKYNSGTIIHELGHVLDNNQSGGLATFVGDGPADAMVLAMGGNPSACNPRLQCWTSNSTPQGHQWYVDNVAGQYAWPLPEYGNNGVSDDFADTFGYTITNPNRVPLGRLYWMRAYLSLLP
jgi:hypothetical protein